VKTILAYLILEKGIKIMILSKKSVYLILVSVLIASTTGMGVFAYAPRYLLNQKVNVIIIQLVLTFFILTTVIIPPIIGKLSDMIQHRALLFKLGAVGVSIIFFFFTFTYNFLFFIILLLLYGFFGMFARLKFVLYAELVENDHRYISYFAATMALGWFLGAFLTGIFIDMYGIELFFQFMLIISFFNLITVMLIREDRAFILQNHEQIDESNDKNFIIDQDKNVSISKAIYPSLFFRNVGIRPILAILAILMFFHISSDSEIGFLIGINFLLQFFLNIVIGRVINQKNIKWIMFFGYSLSIMSIIGWILSTNFWSFLLCQILISLSYSMFYTATQIYIAKNTTPNNKGKYVGFMNASSQFGSFTGGLMFSILLAIYTGNYYTAMYFMIFFPAISALIILFKFEVRSK
jgi:MFS family permease